ncbi:MAG: cyclic nucleotide-binding domain-containing protein [Myxococcales bacterium]|nr:cyclic nucleotide-binding domain-containing protein [Myxococcales bacterium]
MGVPDAKYLKAFGLLHGLDDAAYERLEQAAEVREFSIGEFIVREGDEPAELFFIIEGTVEVIVPRVGFVDLGAGNIFGEASLMEAGAFLPAGWRLKRRNASCVARTKVTAACIDVDRLAEIVKSHPAVQERLSKLAEARSRS